MAGEKSIKTLAEVIDTLNQDPEIINRFGQKGLGQRNLGRAIQRFEEGAADSLLSVFRKKEFIWGEADGLFHLSTARRMAAAVPHSRLVVLPDCAHGLQWEQPQRFAAAFRDLQSSPTAPPLAAPADHLWSLPNT